MISTDLLVALKPVIEALRRLGVPCYIGGSVASSIHGLPRTTLDVDVVADLRLGHVERLVQELEETFYIDDATARQAIERRSSFNLIHLATMIKVDVFVPQDTPYDRTAMSRAVAIDRLSSSFAENLPLASIEDTVLHKLHWYRLGGETSERQWNDILGVLKVQHHRIDWSYMAIWSDAIGVSDLLPSAQRDADIDPDAGSG